MLFKGCPGNDLLRKPGICEMSCPVCGNELEVFSTAPEISCDRCGYTAHNAAYQYAHKHLETEMHDQLVIPQENGANRIDL